MGRVLLDLYDVPGSRYGVLVPRGGMPKVPPPRDSVVFPRQESELITQGIGETFWSHGKRYWVCCRERGCLYAMPY